ncbi:MAG TPA: BON domain-containing protein [Bdellovibrionota bacterium]|nr:BON domain-containing protein [Bdellovibrionota bacterium]
MENGRNLGSLTGGLILGAGLMYLFDPGRGARRRGEIRNQTTHFTKVGSRAASRVVRDLSHRARGFAFSAVSSVRSRNVDDGILHERVRSKLGRHTSHPGPISVVVMGGRVELLGLILENERARLVEAVSEVPGVKEVIDHLEPHLPEDRLTSLQGGIPPVEPASGLLRASWPPATRFLVGGGLLSIVGLLSYLDRARKRVPLETVPEAEGDETHATEAYLEGAL